MIYPVTNRAAYRYPLQPGTFAAGSPVLWCMLNPTYDGANAWEGSICLVSSASGLVVAQAGNVPVNTIRNTGAIRAVAVDSESLVVSAWGGIGEIEFDEDFVSVSSALPTIPPGDQLGLLGAAFHPELRLPDGTDFGGIFWTVTE